MCNRSGQKLVEKQRGLELRSVREKIRVLSLKARKEISNEKSGHFLLIGIPAAIGLCTRSGLWHLCCNTRQIRGLLQRAHFSPLDNFAHRESADC